MPRQSRWVCPTSGVLTLMSLLVVVPVGCQKSTAKVDSIVFAEPEEKDATFRVPDGKPEKILEFLKGMKERKTKFSNRQEALEHMAKSQKAMINAGDKILAQQADEATFREAVNVKLMGTLGLAANPINQPEEAASLAKKTLEIVEQLRKDKRKIVADVANEYWVAARAMNLSSCSDKERTQLSDDAVLLVSNAKGSKDALGDAKFLADQFTKLGESEAAAKLYDRLAKILATLPDQNLQRVAFGFKTEARKIRLIGTPLEIEGKLLGGDELDWKSYRGKVVLVDFWATWCRPCLAELPNVKANYEKYHSKGFDVVGISLDSDRGTLESYVTTEQLPWVQLFDGGSQATTQWQHPMATRYEVSSIPTAYLVDKEGKVVSAEARGEELGHLIRKLLGEE